MRWALLLLVACTHADRADELNGIAEDHRAASEATFADLERVARNRVEVTGTVAGSVLTHDNTVLLPADAGAVHRLIADPRAYALEVAGHKVTYAWLGTPSAIASPAIRLSRDPWPLGTAGLDEGSAGVFTTRKKIALSQFAALADVKYVVLVNTTNLQPLQADAGLFDLAGKAYGGLHLDVGSADPKQAVLDAFQIR